MLGNVWEWCQDWYGSYVPLTEQTLTLMDAEKFYRVARGGGFHHKAFDLRAPARLPLSAGINSGPLGFRLALDK